MEKLAEQMFLVENLLALLFLVENLAEQMFMVENLSAQLFSVKNYTAQMFLAKNQIHISSHTSSLAPCKFLLFVTLSIGLKGHCFAHIKEI